MNETGRISLRGGHGRFAEASFAARLRAGATLLLDWMLPAVCAACERPLAAGHGLPGRGRHGAGSDPVPRGWCEGCARQLAGLHVQRCAVCGERLAAVSSATAPVVATPVATTLVTAPPATRCHRCTIQPPSFDRSIVLADYAPPLDHLVQAIKFGRQSALAAPLGRLLAQAAVRACSQTPNPRPDMPTSVPRPDLMTSIPLAPERLARRGFNQALLLSRPVARELGLRASPDLLDRVRVGAPASSLGAAQRRGTLDHAFVARRELSGATVLIVDDVMTTGATLQAAAAALKDAGAAFVINCVAARTPAPTTPTTPTDPPARAGTEC